MCNIILQSLKSFQLQTFLFSTLMPWARTSYPIKRKWPLQESLIRNCLYKRILLIGQMRWFLRINNMVSKIIPYDELQFLAWPSIVIHSPAGVMYIVYGLVILVHRNIQVTTIMIGYIQLHQGLECELVEEELT